jgi:hypothetical protein
MFLIARERLANPGGIRGDESSTNVVVHAPHVIGICDMVQPKPDSYGRAGMSRAFIVSRVRDRRISADQANSVPLPTQRWLILTQISKASRKTSHSRRSSTRRMIQGKPEIAHTVLVLATHAS